MPIIKSAPAAAAAAATTTAAAVATAAAAAAAAAVVHLSSNITTIEHSNQHGAREGGARGATGPLDFWKFNKFLHFYPKISCAILHRKRQICYFLSPPPLGKLLATIERSNQHGRPGGRGQGVSHAPSGFWKFNKFLHFYPKIGIYCAILHRKRQIC